MLRSSKFSTEKSYDKLRNLMIPLTTFLLLIRFSANCTHPTRSLLSTSMNGDVAFSMSTEKSFLLILSSMISLVEANCLLSFSSKKRRSLAGTTTYLPKTICPWVETNLSKSRLFVLLADHSALIETF